MSLIDGTLLGDRVKVEAGAEAFTLKTAGRFVDKLPANPQENIVYDCWQVFARELEKKSVVLKPLTMTLEKICRLVQDWAPVLARLSRLWMR